MTQMMIPILSYSAPTTNARPPPVGGSSSERTRNASCAAAQRTNRSVGYPPLRQRAIPFHVAKYRLIPSQTLSFFALRRLLLSFLMGSGHTLQIPLITQSQRLHIVQPSHLLPNGRHPVQAVQHRPSIAVEPYHLNEAASTMTGPARGC